MKPLLKSVERAQKNAGLIGGGVALAALGVTDNTAIIQAFGLISLCASFLSALLPTPEEIPARWYRLVYNIIRRAALNGPWLDKHNGNAPEKNGSVTERRDV